MATIAHDIKLTPREQAYLVAALLSNKGGIPAIQPDFEKFASYAGLKSVGSAQTMWYGVRKKIFAGAGADTAPSGPTKAAKGGYGTSGSYDDAPGDGLDSSGEVANMSSVPPPAEKKKRTRKPKAEVTTGEGKPARNPPRKRAKKSDAVVHVQQEEEVIPEPVASPVEEDNDGGMQGELEAEEIGGEGDEEDEQNGEIEEVEEAA